MSRRGGEALLRTLCGCEKTIDIDWPPSMKTIVEPIPRALGPLDPPGTASFGQRVFRLWRVLPEKKWAEYREVP